MRYALIRNGLVENVIEADDTYVVPDYIVVEAQSVGPGWTYDGSTFHEPTPQVIVPQVIEMWRVKAVLDAHGLLARADTLATNASAMVRQFWRASIYVERLSPTLTYFARQLGLDDAALDALFIEAQGLTI